MLNDSSVNINPRFLKLRKWIPIEKLEWHMLSRNPNAIHILENNLYKVYWYALSRNPNIFEYDYKEIKNTLYDSNGFVEELMANRFHPSNMDQWHGWGFDDIIGIDQE